MRAEKIMIIRHAEKPYQASDGTQFKGVTKHGKPDNEALIVRGWQRAGALAAFFTPLPDGTFMNARIGEPATLFASKTEDKTVDEDQQKVGSKSKRPIETITPLSNKLGVEIDDDFSKGNEVQLAYAAMSCEGVVLICWEHQSIPSIAQNIPVSVSPPSEWPTDKNGEGRFDVVWVFDLDPVQNQYRFSSAYQCLLSGDLPGEQVQFTRSSRHSLT